MHIVPLFPIECCIYVPSFYSILGKDNSIVSTCINVTKDKLVPVSTWVELTFVIKLGNMKGGHYFKVDYNNLMEKVTFLPIKYSWGFVQFSMSHYCPFHPSLTMASFWHLCPTKLIYPCLVKNLWC